MTTLLFTHFSGYLLVFVGTVPLRHLVYRVLDLPASMKPLVYDYGGLTANTEEAYISRIVENHVRMTLCMCLAIL